MTFLDTEMKELGRSTQQNIYHTILLISTLKYVKDIVTDRKSLYGERVHTHTYKHTHKHTHTHTHTLTQIHTRMHKCTITWNL